MKKVGVFILISCFLVGINTEAIGQRKKKKKTRESKTEVVERQNVQAPWMEKMSYDVRIGNVSLFGPLTRVALKSAASYRINNFLSAGLAAKYEYNFYNNNQSQNPALLDYSWSHFGVGPFVRAKIFQTFYLQAEYDYHNLATENSVFDEGDRARNQAWSPMIGGGYLSGFGDWVFGIEVLFVGNNEVRDNSIGGITGNVIEYWIAATYNF